MAIPLAHFLSRCKGFFTMWRGCGPTVSRAIVLNAAQLGTYDQAKQMLLQTGIDPPISCFFYLFSVSSPFLFWFLDLASRLGYEYGLKSIYRGFRKQHGYTLYS